MAFFLDPWLQLVVCWNSARWSVQVPQISRELFRAFHQMNGLCNTWCVFCKASRLALRIQVPHRNSVLSIVLTSFRMRNLRPRCLNDVIPGINDWLLIYCPRTLISFLETASPLSSNLAQIYFSWLLSLNLHPLSFRQVQVHWETGWRVLLLSPAPTFVVLVHRAATTLNCLRMNIGH